MKILTAFILFSASSLGLFAQETNPQPAPAYVPPPANATTANSPHDYGKDPYIQKIKKRIISFGFFSPLNQHISFGYDQLMGSDVVFTGQLGIIGPGITSTAINDPTRPSGAFAELGAKLFFSPDFVTDGLHRYNSMKGGYFKPQVVISSFDLTTYNYNYYGNPYPQQPTTSRVNHTGVALILNFGKQWILAGSVTLDMYAGIGYSVNSTSGIDYVSNYYSYESTGTVLPLAFTAGLNLGIPF